MANENNDKLIERIRKLYAMAQDSSSPNEAAIAAKRARSLMDANGITLADLEQSDFGAATTNWTRKNLPTWYQGLALNVAKLNDCMLQRQGNVLTFKGFDVDAICANLMLDYLMESMNRQRLAWQKETGNKEPRHKRSFQVGFSCDMCSRLYAMIEERNAAAMANNGQTGTALVCVKMKMVESEFGATKERKGRRLTYQSGEGFDAGMTASQRTNLNAQVSGATQKALSAA